MEDTDKEFLKMIIASAEKIAEKKEMPQNEKNQYIIERIFDFFEKREFDEISKEFLEECQKYYPDLKEDEINKYIILHTKNEDVVYNEKIKLEKKILRIEDELYQNKRELGIGMVIKKEDRPKYLFGKIEEVEKKYNLDAGEDEKMCDEKIEEYNALIDEMVKEYEKPEELHMFAKEHQSFFTGLGSGYFETLKEKSPQYGVYISESLEKELEPYMHKKEAIKSKIDELNSMKDGLRECIEKIYDPRLDEKRRGKVDKKVIERYGRREQDFIY